MPDDDIPKQPELTLDDVLSSGLNAILDQNPSLDYTDIYGTLAKAARDAEAAGELVNARAFGFMAAISSMSLTPTERAAPFQPLARWSDGSRSFVPEDLSVEQVDLLASLAGAVDNQLLRARLAELVWMKSSQRRNIAFPRMAIDGYCAHPIDDDTWHMSGQVVWHRALQLASSIGAGAENRLSAIEAALLAAFDLALNSATLEALWYVRPLYAEKRGVAAAPRIAGEFERIGRERLAAGRVFDAESFFEDAERWYERAKLPEKQADMLAMAGATQIAMADASESAMARQEFIGRAIKAYREVPAPYRAVHKVEETIEDLRTKLAAAGRLALGEMKIIKGPTVDLSEFVAESVRRVQGKSAMDALLCFCTLQSFPNRELHYQQAAELVSQSLIGRLFGGVVLAADGRAIARRFGADNGAAAEASQTAVYANKACISMVAMTTIGMIMPALDAMQMDSVLKPLDFFHLASTASLVPRDRVDLVAKGLYAGYCGDYVQAIHILVPQFEHMVRVALQDAGSHTTTHDKFGIDMEAGLSTLVQRPQMMKVFGADLTFTIESLMCEQEGPNLRNAVAHGLADSSLCNSVYGIYAWWLILRLVVECFVADRHATLQEPPSLAEPSSNK